MSEYIKFHKEPDFIRFSLTDSFRATLNRKKNGINGNHKFSQEKKQLFFYGYALESITTQIENALKLIRLEHLLPN